MFFKKNRKIERAVIRLISMVKLNGAVLQREIDSACRDLSEKELHKVLKILRKKKVIMESGILQYSKDVIGDEEKRHNELRQYVTKKEIMKTTADHTEVASQFVEGIVATGFPEQAKEAFFDRVIADKSNFDYTIYLSPSSVRALEIYLTKELKQVEKDIHTSVQRGMSESVLERRKKYLSTKIDDLKQGKYNMFEMSIYFASKGVNEETAKKVSKSAMSSLLYGGVEGKFATNYQKQLYLSIFPLGIDRLKGRRIIVPSTVAATAFPFRI